MDFPVHATIDLSDAAATSGFASALSTRMGPGDVLLLSGEIGAGKTHFARSLIQQLLPMPEDVPSPTFTLVQTYETPDFEIWHSDLYRLGDVSEVEELGLLDAFDTALCLVEWPDKLGADTPERALSLRFRPGATEDARRVDLGWRDPRWTELLRGLT